MRTFVSENRNLIVFLTCSVISTAIWMSMGLSKNYTKIFTSKLVFINVPANKILNSDTINIITTIDAKGWDLAFKKSTEKIISIDLAKYPNRKVLEFSNLESLIEENDNKLKVVDVNPKSFKLQYINLVSKKVPITLDLKKEFKSNFFFLKEPVINPDSILVSSDEETLKEISFIKSEPIIISEKDDFLKDIKLLTTDKYRIKQKNFSVKFDIKEFVEKEFTVNVNIDNNKNDVELIIFPEQVMIKCLVPITIYENISASDFYISADFNNIEVQKNNKLLLSVKEQPEGVRNVQLQKDRIEFIIYQ